MRKHIKMGYVAAGIFMALSYFFIYVIQTTIDQRRDPFSQTERDLYIQSGDRLRKLSLGYDSLIADIYWLRTIQYYGNKRKNVDRNRYDLLEALLDLTISLDPEMTYVYRFGATFLAEPQPVGLGDPLKAIRLLDKGLNNNPNVWRFYFDKGFVYLWHLKDYKSAAATFLQGSHHPLAPKWLETISAFCLTKGGELETARYLWKKQYEEAESNDVRENALNHLNSIQIDEDISVLEFLIEKYETKTGQPIRSLKQLVAAGMIKSLPRDPSGLPYGYYGDSQSVGLSRESKVKYFPMSAQQRKELWSRLESKVPQ